MQQKRLPIFDKVSNLVKISIFIAKTRKPIIQKLIFLKKSRKLKRFKLLKHYNYRFLEEYEFSSASSTPLVHYHRKKQQLKNRSRRQDIYSMFCLSKCFGSGLKAEGGETLAIQTSAVPAIRGEFVEPISDLVDDEEDDSVDDRAEKFIEWFYQEMRMQRHDSV